MSTYYDFYVGVKKDDKIEAIGPYIRKDGEYHLVPIVSRSRSFIHFDEFGYWDLPIEMMADDQVEFFTSEGWTSDERHSISCYIPYEDIRAMADDGLVQGYVTLNELDMVAANDYSHGAFDRVLFSRHLDPQRHPWPAGTHRHGYCHRVISMEAQHHRKRRPRDSRVYGAFADGIRIGNVY